MSYFTDVTEWDDATGCDAPAELRRAVMVEEWVELAAAIDGDDLIGIADACADLIFTVCGLAKGYGIPFDAVWAEVMRSNMAKVGPNGEVYRNEAGKIVKPPGWTPPDIGSILLAPSADDETAEGGD